MSVEYQSALKQPEIVEPPQKRYRETKYWILAKRRYNDQHKQLSNSNLEFAYHRLLKKVRALFAPRGEFMFERDYKSNRDSGPLRMHVLMCESMYLELWCCFSEYYFVDYHFDSCPFEQEVLDFFKANGISKRTRHFPLDKGFFERNKQREDEKFFYYLKVEAAE